LEHGVLKTNNSGRHYSMHATELFYCYKKWPIRCCKGKNKVDYKCANHLNKQSSITTIGLQLTSLVFQSYARFGNVPRQNVWGLLQYVPVRKSTTLTRYNSNASVPEEPRNESRTSLDILRATRFTISSSGSNIPSR